MTTVAGATAMISIDGQSYEAPNGMTVMEVAHSEGLPMASLCYSKRLNAYGSCRMCMVQIQGQRALAAACTTPVRDGMIVITNTPDIERIRRTLLELYLSEDARDYRPGGGNGRDELHALAAQYGAHPDRFAAARHEHRSAKTDNTSPFFSFDSERCILCARCVRACDSIQGQNVLHVKGRGFHTDVVPGLTLFQNSDCVTCGACVKECPTDALSDKMVLKYGAGESSRAVRTTCTYCGVGCQFDAQVSGNRIVQMLPADDSPVNAGHACVKGRYAFGYVDSPDRLRQPLVRSKASDELHGSLWDEAIALIADRFNDILHRYGPDSIACISSGRGTNEENYLLQKFARVSLGNNNIDNCARVCHSSTVAGMQEVIGTGAATNSLGDIDAAKLILIVGANPTEGHPVTGARIKRAVRNGAKLIVIDPRKIELTKYADIHLQLRPGTNIAILNGLAHVIITEELVNDDFIDKRTENFQAFCDTVMSYTPEYVEEISGVPANLLREAARNYATSGASMAMHGLGVTEHLTGSHGVMALANLAIMTGNIGRPGTGINPLRGQNNVQGSCDMGALPNVLTAYQKVNDPQVQAKFESAWGRSIPQQTGLKIPEMWDAAISGKLKAMWIMGYDALHTEPNVEKVRKALSSLELLIVSDLFMCQTAQLAHVVLPVAGALEKEGTFSNGERRVQRVRRVVNPPGDARTDWEAICAVSTAMGVPMHYDNAAQIMDEIAQLTPPMGGISFRRLDEEGGLQWPVPDGTHPGTSILHVTRFPRGKARFAAVEYTPPGEEADLEYPLVLVTGRVLQHYNSGTMTRRTVLSEVVGRDYMEMHPSDAHAIGLSEGSLTQVTSRRSSIQLMVHLTEKVTPGMVFTSFHFPDEPVNALLSSSSDAITRCPEYKVLAVRVEPVFESIKMPNQV